MLTLHLHHCPYREASKEENGTKILVTLLSSKPDKEKLANLVQYIKSSEKLHVKGQEIYLYCPNGYGKSKLSNTFIESKLETKATTRNWKTVQKLYLLSMNDKGTT